MKGIWMSYPPWNQQARTIFMDGWKMNFLLGKPIFRGELLVLGMVHDWCFTWCFHVLNDQVHDQEMSMDRFDAWFVHDEYIIVDLDIST